MITKGKKYFKYSILPYNPKLKEYAKYLRSNSTLAEVLLWSAIKGKQLQGLTFIRQNIIGNFIVDFYCPNLGLIIEIDGSSHDDKYDYDVQRESYLKN